MGEIINPLLEARFQIEQFVEPQPTEPYRWPERDEKESRDPVFLCVRARYQWRHLAWTPIRDDTESQRTVTAASYRSVGVASEPRGPGAVQFLAAAVAATCPASTIGRSRTIQASISAAVN